MHVFNIKIPKRLKMYQKKRLQNRTIEDVKKTDLKLFSFLRRVLA